ncbi:MAG: hypothetical protein J5612_05075 [Paludibacteraceae bacterium]|nr:hypothetical protein [Paludibacteraceae bacterium]
MEVRDIFALRKAGRVEEAYDLIREKYKTYHGHYTTLCMFWCASDVLQLRVEEGRMEEAKKILAAMERMLPNMRDEDVIGNQMVKLRRLVDEAKTER